MNGLTKSGPLCIFIWVSNMEKQMGPKLLPLDFSELNMIKIIPWWPPPLQKIHNKRKLTSLNFKQKYHRGNCKAPVMFQKLNYWTCLQIFSNPSSPNAWYFINFNYNKVPCAFIITTEKCYCEQKYGNKHANDFFLRFG